METCIPQAVLKARKNLPWLTKSVIQAMWKRNLLFNATKRSNSPSDWERYKCIRNKVVAMLRQNKKQNSGRQLLSWSTSRTPQFLLSGMAVLQSPQMMPRPSFSTLTSMSVSITRSFRSMILPQLTLKTVLLPHFAQRNKSWSCFAPWILPNLLVLMEYLPSCSNKLLSQLHPVWLNYSTCQLLPARFPQIGNVQESHRYSKLPIPHCLKITILSPFYRLQANFLSSIFVP